MLVAATSGCQPASLYDWGGYEDSLYRAMVQPGKDDVTTQSTRLTADIQKTLSRHRRVPPGVRAHLGYLYFLQGRASEALAEFEAERTAFPESTVFIDGIIARMKRPANAAPAAILAEGESADAAGNSAAPPSAPSMPARATTPPLHTSSAAPASHAPASSPVAPLHPLVQPAIPGPAAPVQPAHPTPVKPAAMPQVPVTTPMQPAALTPSLSKVPAKLPQVEVPRRVTKPAANAPTTTLPDPIDLTPPSFEERP